MEGNQHITLNTIDAVHLIELRDILYCKSNNSYTTFYIVGHEPIVVSKSIREYERKFQDSHFFRTHQSYLVNLGHIKKIDKQNGFTLLLTDESKIPISTRNRKKLLQILQDV